MINPSDNTHFLDRLAAIDMTTEVAGEAIRVLSDAGFRIVGSLHSKPLTDTIRLVIEGDALPPECDDRLKLVTLLMVQDAYGDQRLVRVQDVRVVGIVPRVEEMAA